MIATRGPRCIRGYVRRSGKRRARQGRVHPIASDLAAAVGVLFVSFYLCVFPLLFPFFLSLSRSLSPYFLSLCFSYMHISVHRHGISNVFPSIDLIWKFDTVVTFDNILCYFILNKNVLCYYHVYSVMRSR